MLEGSRRTRDLEAMRPVPANDFQVSGLRGCVPLRAEWSQLPLLWKAAQLMLDRRLKKRNRSSSESLRQQTRCKLNTFNALLHGRLQHEPASRQKTGATLSWKGSARPRDALVPEIWLEWELKRPSTSC